MNLKAVLFDLHNTLVYLGNPLSSEEVSEFLLQHGCEVYPQSWDAASHYVGMVDYPKHGYTSRQAFTERILRRLDTEADNDTLRKFVQLYDRRNRYSLFSDAAPAVRKAKELGLKTAIVTTIPDFVFSAAIAPIRECIDIVMTGHRAGCEKSNPAMHEQTLEELETTPEQAVMIGDELLVDIRIPKKLGMQTILLDRSSKFKKKPREADRKAGTLIEAMAIVTEWHRQETKKR